MGCGPTSYSVGTRGLKRTHRGVEVKKEWSSTSVPRMYGFMVWKVSTMPLPNAHVKEEYRLWVTRFSFGY